jgi:hypothetical protein
VIHRNLVPEVGRSLIKRPQFGHTFPIISVSFLDPRQQQGM